MVTTLNGMLFILTDEIKKMKLVKTSSQNDIREYFLTVKTLRSNGQEYPVNLDTVWGLCFSRKDTALRSLKKEFIENKDFISIRVNVEREIGASRKDEIMLSINCFEYLIAKRVESVFAVYREVFHEVTDDDLKFKQPIKKEISLLATELSTLKDEFDAAISLANIIYTDRNQAIQAANRLIQKATGKDVLNLLEVDRLISQDNTIALTPTEISKITEPLFSAQQVNKFLQEKGYQHKVGYDWIPSEKGMKYAIMYDVRLGLEGRSRKQLLWKHTILDVITEKD